VQPAAVSATDTIRASLKSGHGDADRILGEARLRAAELSELAAQTDLAMLDARLDRLVGLRSQIAGQQRRIEGAYAALAEAMAVSSMRLAEAARDADFGVPEWPAGIRRTVEVRLAETREVTFRFETGGEPPDPRL
jgi:hypothetical protein